MLYGGLLGLTYYGFLTVPKGFIPNQDKGYLIVNAQLPEGASLERSDAVVARHDRDRPQTKGVAHTIGVPGYSVLTEQQPLERGRHVRHPRAVRGAGGQARTRAPTRSRRSLRRSFREIQEAQVAVFGAPPVDGLGSTGGFKMQVQDRRGLGPLALQGAVANVIEKASAQPGLTGLFSSFTANQPQLYVDVDRVKAKQQGVSLTDVFDTLAGLPRLGLRQRRDAVQSQLAGQRPGRRRASGCAARTSAS